MYSYHHRRLQAYNKSSSAVVSNSNTLKWFKTTVRGRQSRILSLSLFNNFLEQTKTNALEGLVGTVAVGGWKQFLKFEDDIHDLIVGSKENLHLLQGDWLTYTLWYGMKIRTETSNDTVTTRKDKTLHHILDWMERRCMVEMNNFQYIGSTLNEEIK